MKYALVRDGVVENLIELDPELLIDVPYSKVPNEEGDDWIVTPARPAWQPPQGTTLHEAGMPIEVGWQWNDGDPAPLPKDAGLALTEAKARALAEVAAAHDAAINAGLDFEGKNYQIDTVSQGRILARALFARACLDGAGEWPEDFGWIATDNTRPTFTAEQFWAFANDAQMRVTEITLNARALKDAVLAAADLEAVEAIDPYSGW
jgi:hypothetical protein